MVPGRPCCILATLLRTVYQYDNVVQTYLVSSFVHAFSCGFCLVFVIRIVQILLYALYISSRSAGLNIIQSTGRIIRNNSSKDFVQLVAVQAGFLILFCHEKLPHTYHVRECVRARWCPPRYYTIQYYSVSNSRSQLYELYVALTRVDATTTTHSSSSSKAHPW